MRIWVRCHSRNRSTAAVADGALVNLMENALDACAAGGRIQLDAQRMQELVCIRVRDNGRGMDAVTQTRLFEPFFTTRAEGTGLGLAIARGVARAHGGGIEVASEPGAGAVFSLTLPGSINLSEIQQPLERRTPCLTR